MRDEFPDVGSTDPLNLHGIVPPIVTVFEDDESVNLEATAAHAEFVVENGVHGVFPLGTNGEFALLNDAERRAVIEAVTEAVGDTVPVIAGVGSPGTHQTIQQARHAEGCGADGVVVITPYYYPVDGDGYLSHYRAIADAISLPVYIYHIPGNTGNKISLETLNSLATIDNLAGVKDSSKDIPWLAQAIDANPELSFLAGSDSLLVPGFDAGCTGAVSAIANAFPSYIVSLYEAYRTGDRATATARQSDVFAIRRALKAGPYLSGVKTALSLRDDLSFDPGSVRRPLREMTATQRSELRETLESVDLL